MPVGDAEDKARYEKYHRLVEAAKRADEKAITAPTERERRAAAEAAQVYRSQAFHLFA